MTRARINADQAHTESLSVVPHIIPDVLYPSSGNDLAGDALVATTDGPNSSTVASSKYGTVQASDGRMYYYTDIKGSKPIRDPRIGGHFGSQRYPCDSLQLLEQETATHGENVYSIDGREWMRATGTQVLYNINSGNFFQLQSTGTVEIVGYFSDANLSSETRADTARGFVTHLDGGSASSENTSFETTVDTPLGGRYVDRGSSINLDLPTTHSATLGIHTLKIVGHAAGTNLNFFNIELIAQDTTSTATKSQIQIPSQNVVSYGKKFTVSGTPHYDPFNGFTNDTTLFSSVVDVATSLGLGTATTWGTPWDKGSDDHIRPFNGGRVVKWVDSSGTIKTSVTMMPANAQASNTTASNEITTASATNSHTINFSDDAIENSLSEVAKTFEVREFGNGNANGGATGTYKDVSMLDTTGRDVAYVMDDGLTSLSAADHRINTTEGIYADSDAKSLYITFIGTGISVNYTGQDSSTGVEHRMYIDGIEVHYLGSNPSTNDGIVVVAQNLPYGTHIFQFKTITKGNADAFLKEVTFHQPKKPPIPEDAVVLVDYMLMADFVPQTAAGADYISKGTRMVSASRDIFYDSSDGAFDLGIVAGYGMGAIRVRRPGAAGSVTSTSGRLPFFGTNYVARGYDIPDTTELYIGSSSQTTTSGGDNIHSSFRHLSTSGTFPSVQDYRVNQKAAGQFILYSIDVATPIHTSSHYQTFETPFLYELVGGDRNMEQTNLVVTPDGKTWDEVTRDVSYIGNSVLSTTTNTAFNSDTNIIFDDWRGNEEDIDYFLYNKDFAIAYDRIIALKDGQYNFWCWTIEDAATNAIQLFRNGTATANLVAKAYTGDHGGNYETVSWSVDVFVKRGDYYVLRGGWHADANHSRFGIRRI